jgi:hypothetical protein
MTNLPELLQQIGRFYKGATHAFLQSLAAPEDEEEGLYDKMVEAARQVSDPDIADQILLLAKMYRKAVEVGGGFNLVNQGIDNLVNMLEMEDEEEQSSVEDLLNEVSHDLRQRAKTAAPDDEAVMMALKNARDQHYRGVEEGMEEPSAYEVEMEQFPGGAGGTHDPEEAKTKGRGFYHQTRNYKDWIQSYENERQRYLHDLTAPELQLSRTGQEARRNTAARNNLMELVKILAEMGVLKQEEATLEADLQAAPDPAKETRLAQVKQELGGKQDRRIVLKKSLAKHQYAQQNKTLADEVKTATDPKEKFLAEQKMKLNELMMSPDRGKGEEAKWRRVLINSMSEGRSIPPEQVERLSQKIQEGAAKKRRATDVYRQKAEQVAGKKGLTGPVRERQVGQFGEFGKRNRYNFDILPLDGLIEHLTQRLATERIVVKQKVTDKMKKTQQDPATLKPFMDDVAKAATKKDKTAFLAATQRLKAKMTEIKNVQPEVVQYVISLRSSKFLYGFRDRAKRIGEWIGTDLEPEQVSFIDDTIREGKKLISFYRNLSVKHPLLGTPTGTTHYKPPTEIIEKIVKNLEGAKYGS